MSKRRDPSLAFFSIAAVAAALVASPILIAHHRVLPLIPLTVWVLILATGMAQAVYFSGLAGAYSHGDMSLAYPLARALPVVAVAVISLLIGKGAEIGRISLIGMLLIFFGCLILPLPHFRGLRLGDYTSVVILMAIVAAAGTTAYTLIDDTALRQLHSNANLPLNSTQITLLFISLQMLSTAVLLAITLLVRASERQQAAQLVRSHKNLVLSMVTGIVIMVTYGLVLVSMAYVRNVSYVSAFRQLSIPIGALLGLVLANESRCRPKLAGITIITVGLVLVGLG